MVLLVGNFISFTIYWSEAAEFPKHAWLEGQSHVW